MSLIRVRRERKRDGIDIKKGRSTQGLFVLLCLVGIAIWFLSTQF